MKKKGLSKDLLGKIHQIVHLKWICFGGATKQCLESQGYGEHS